MRVRALWVGGLLAASCSGPSSPQGGSQLRIETDQAEYGSGSDVVVRFTNTSSDVVSYNGCVGFIERRSGTRWSSVAPAADRPCRDNLTGLMPGESATSALTLPSTLVPGQYRYRFTAVYGTGDALLPSSERVTNAFTIIVRD